MNKNEKQDLFLFNDPRAYEKKFSLHMLRANELKLGIGRASLIFWCLSSILFLSKTIHFQTWLSYMWDGLLRYRNCSEQIYVLLEAKAFFNSVAEQVNINRNGHWGYFSDHKLSSWLCSVKDSICEYKDV